MRQTAGERQYLVFCRLTINPGSWGVQYQLSQLARLGTVTPTLIFLSRCLWSS